MADDAQPNRRLIDKVAALPAEQAAVVEAFVDDLSDREIVGAAQAGSEATFAAAWSDDDAIYDGL